MFFENSVIKKFVTDMFDAEYNEADAPKWVNFQMFRSDLTEKLSNQLFQTMQHLDLDFDETMANDEEYTEEYADENKTSWASDLMIPYYGNSYDPSTNFDFFNKNEITIPREIIEIFQKMEVPKTKKTIRKSYMKKHA